MAKRKHFTKKQREWRRNYTEIFHGIDPIMGEQEFEEGTMSWEDYTEYNLSWITDNVAEKCQQLRDKI